MCLHSSSVWFCREGSGQLWVVFKARDTGAGWIQGYTVTAGVMSWRPTDTPYKGSSLGSSAAMLIPKKSNYVVVRHNLAQSALTGAITTALCSCVCACVGWGGLDLKQFIDLSWLTCCQFYLFWKWAAAKCWFICREPLMLRRWKLELDSWLWKNEDVRVTLR